MRYFDLAGGVYLYKLASESFVDTKKAADEVDLIFLPKKRRVDEIRLLLFEGFNCSLSGSKFLLSVPDVIHKHKLAEVVE